MKLNPRISLVNKAWTQAGNLLYYVGEIPAATVINWDNVASFPDVLTYDITNPNSYSSSVRLDADKSGPNLSVIAIRIPIHDPSSFTGADFVAFGGFPDLNIWTPVDYEIHSHTNGGGSGTPATIYTGSLTLSSVQEGSTFGSAKLNQQDTIFLLEHQIPANTTFIDIFLTSTSSMDFLLSQVYVGSFYYFQFSDFTPEYNYATTTKESKNWLAQSVYSVGSTRITLPLKFSILNEDEALLLDEFLFTWGKSGLCLVDPFYKYDAELEEQYRRFYKPISWGTLKRLPRSDKYSINITFREEKRLSPIYV